MRKLPFALFAALLASLAIATVAHADDFTVPIVVDSTTYTLTIRVAGDQITVLSNDDDLTVGSVTPVVAESPADLAAVQAAAETIPYDDLFRYNERYVGQAVRYVGKVLEFQERSCLILCDEPEYILRINVTQDQYGFWDDTIWVEYSGSDRFLEDDIVTLWGVVEGLESYTAVLGNTITIPKVRAVALLLGQVDAPAQAGPEERAPVAAAADERGPVANRNANLRGGPGTDFAVVGGVTEGEALEVVARNQDASWLQLDGGAWIAAFLVDNVGEPSALPLAEEIPQPPEAEDSVAEGNAAEDSAPEATAPTAGSSPSAGTFAMNQEMQSSGWRFNVKEVHKRKSVYFYGDPHVAMGTWLVVIMDAVNEQSGTDYFANNLSSYLVDAAGNSYRADIKGSGYAEWQYGGLSSVYSDVDPGKLARIVWAFDVPDGAGRLTLRLGDSIRVDLGDFSQLPAEE